MISKDTFIKTMNILKKEYEFSLSLGNLFRNNRDIVGDSDFYGYVGITDCCVELLEEALELKKGTDGYTDLSYYIYETDYGKDSKAFDSLELTNLPEDHMYRTPFLTIKDDFEKLYDYLTWTKDYDKMGNE